MNSTPVFSAGERNRRLEATRAAMDEQGLDALLLFAGGEIPGFSGDVAYLTGYLPIFEYAWCVVTMNTCDLVLPRWEWRHTNGATWLASDHVHRDEERVVSAHGGAGLVDRLLGDASRIGISNPDSIPTGLAGAVGLLGRDERFVRTSLLEQLRRRKSVEEVDAIRAAAAITDVGIRAFFEGVSRGGLTEIDLACEIEKAMRVAGVERFSIPIVLGAGPGSLDVAVQPTARRIDRGDMVLLDCACRHHGYLADTARGAVYGEPTAEQRRLLDTVLIMYREALKLLTPGVDVRAPHRRAVEVAADSGYAYLHETGHSIGCDPHEPPWIDEGPHEETFEQDMVVAIEPGLYYEGIGGCRIENTILITADGPLELNEAPLTSW